MLDPATLTAHLARLDRDGYTIVEGAFEAALADALLADLERLEEQLGEGPGKNPFEGYKTVRIYNLLARGKIYEQIPVHDAVLPIVEGVLIADASCPRCRRSRSALARRRSRFTRTTCSSRSPSRTRGAHAIIAG